MTSVQKWGNSLAVRIPAALAAQVDLAAGAPVELTAQNGSLVIRPVKPARYRLQDLLKDCRPSQLHGEFDLGDPVGREVVE
jgi:antitoxin MazE